MKKLMLILLSAFTLTAYSQITLEHTYTASAYITDLEQHGMKYFDMDVYTNSCNIYNLDHSLWKSIALDVPQGNYLSDIRYVTTNLFNEDDLVEVCYTWYNYDSINLYFTYTTNIVNEEGTQLLTVPGANYTEVVEAGENDFKLLAYVWDYSVIPSTLETRVYDIPGTASLLQERAAMTGSPYPNPVKDVLHIPLKNNASGVLHLMNAEGKPVKSVAVISGTGTSHIETGDLAAGIYYLQLKSGKQYSEIKKIIKQP